MENLYNLNIERAVLSAIIFDPQIYEESVATLKPYDFYLPFHQYLFESMGDLYHEEKPIDEEFLRSKLQSKGKFDETAMLELLSANPIANTLAYIKEIKSKASKRALVTLATEIKKTTIEDDLPAEEVMNLVERKLFEITQNSTNEDFRESKEITLAMLDEINRLKSMGNSKLIGTDTGFRNLNEKTSGFGKGDLVIIAARPAMGKCLGKGTKVLMYDGTLKNVEDIAVGDRLMGDDSTPRNVLSLARGREEMYWVRQNKGIDYRVNQSHILSLKRSRNEGKHVHGDMLNIEVLEYIQKSDKFKTNYKGHKVSVEFDQKPLEIEPYFLGLWLGDGRSSDVRIATEDDEVVEYLQEYAFKLDKKLHRYAVDGKCTMFGITNIQKEGALRNLSDSLQGKLRRLGVIDNKHIPHEYLTGDTEQRLALLAGLVDSDGYYDDKHHVIEIVQKNKTLAEQIKFLADSLGFRVSLVKKEATINTTGYKSDVFRTRIVGNLETIPTRIERKKARALSSKRDHRHTGIQVEFDKIDDYYGFVLDGNHLFLLEDMTVTHNTAFVLNMALKAIERNEGVAFFSLEMPAEQLMLRMLSAKTSIPLQSLRVGDLTDGQWSQLSAATGEMANKKLFVDDGGYATIQKVRSKLRKLKSRHPEITIAIIDYLQLMSGDGKEGRQQEVSEISRGLKQLARELQIPIVALSQLNRGLEARENKRPMLSDLRESGAIEQDADIILFVYRDDVYREAKEKEKEMKAKAEGKPYTSEFRKKSEEEAEIIIGKQRNGPTGTVELIFQKQFTRFVDASHTPAFEVVYEDSNIPINIGNIDLPQF